jgi:serine/threonine protein kinase
MGEVHLALHERTGRKVALKLLPARHMGDVQRVRRFQQEARAVPPRGHPRRGGAPARLRHAHLAD